MKLYRDCMLPVWGLPVVIALFSSASAQALTNGGFETGDLTGWTVVGVADATGPYTVMDSNDAFNLGGPLGPPEGSFQGRLFNAGGESVGDLESALGLSSGVLAATGTQGANFGSVIYQNISVQAGDRISLLWAFDFGFDDGNPATDDDFAFIAFDTDVTLLARTNALVPITTGYHFFEHVFAAAGDVTVAFGVIEAAGDDPIFGSDNDIINSVLLVDAVTLTPVPEPVTAGLCMLGLIALTNAATRRRRAL